MPSTGYVLADLYQRPVFFFSATWSETILPSSCPPKNNSPVFLTLVGNHYIILQLKNPSLFPAPKLMRNWDSYSSPEALAWKDRYSACIEMTQELKKKTRSSRITYQLLPVLVKIKSSLFPCFFCLLHFLIFFVFDHILLPPHTLLPIQVLLKFDL